MAADSKIFPVFCTADTSSEVGPAIIPRWLLTTFLLYSNEPERDGRLDSYSANTPISQAHEGIGSVTGSVILRSHTLSNITAQTPLPVETLPEPVAPTPFKNWTPELCIQFLANHAPHTRVHESLFIIIDERSAQDLSCLVCEHGIKFQSPEAIDRLRGVGRELKTVRSSFRNCTMVLCNLDIANMGIEEYQDSADAHGGVDIMEGEEVRKKDLAKGTTGFLDEHILRSGKVVRED